MCSQTEDTLGNLTLVDKSSPQNTATKLYPKYNTYLEPNSVTYIPLKFRQKLKQRFAAHKDLLIKGNNSFMKRKLLQIDRINICTLQTPIIAIFNTKSTGVSISKNDVVATAETCDNEMQYHADVQLLKKLQYCEYCKPGDINYSALSY